MHRINIPVTVGAFLTLLLALFILSLSFPTKAEAYGGSWYSGPSYYTGSSYYSTPGYSYPGGYGYSYPGYSYNYPMYQPVYYAPVYSYSYSYSYGYGNYGYGMDPYWGW